MTFNLQPNIVSDAVYALSSSRRVLYAARASGLTRSRDGGAAWENCFASLSDQETPPAVAVAAAGQTVFAGAKGAVLRSDDGGDSWHTVALAAPPPLVVALALSPAYAEDGVVIAGTAEDGVFVSTDQGETWIPWNFGLIDLNVYALAISPSFARDRTVFAGTESGIFRSSNGGRGWREINFPMEAAPVLCLHLAEDGALYAGTEAHGLYRSDDQGVTWQPLTIDGAAAPVHAIHAVSASQLIVLLEDRLLRSADRGQTWGLPAYTFPPSRSALTVLPLANGDLLIGFADGELQRVTA
jgi:photosystem II stability/assembly factor-like uncharacterized protein